MLARFSITPFNGEKKYYCTFVHQLNILFFTDQEKFNTNDKKILFALNQMKGEYAKE
jgi:hypothetical protein